MFIDYEGTLLQLNITKTQFISVGVEGQDFNENRPGLLDSKTMMKFSVDNQGREVQIVMEEDESEAMSVMNPDFTFDQMGIGGLK